MVRKIRIFADGADLKTMAALADNPDVAGFTTNPSLMRKAGVTDYRKFAREVLAIAAGRPVSFEVFADDIDGMLRQARTIAGWGDSVWVKIPIVNTAGILNDVVISELAADSVQINVTAVMTDDQVRSLWNWLDGVPGKLPIVSIFAGRIADAGWDPVDTMRKASIRFKDGGADLLWASTREVFNVIQAEDAGAHIITMTPDLIAKLPGFGRDLGEYSRQTVVEFYKAGEGFTL